MTGIQSWWLNVYKCVPGQETNILCKFMSVFLSCKTGRKISTCCVGGLLEGADKLVIDEHNVDGECTSIKNYLFLNFFLSFPRPKQRKQKTFAQLFSAHMKHKDSEIYAVIKASDGGDMRNFPNTFAKYFCLKDFDPAKANWKCTWVWISVRLSNVERQLKNHLRADTFAVWRSWGFIAVTVLSTIEARTEVENIFRNILFLFYKE